MEWFTYTLLCGFLLQLSQVVFAEDSSLRRARREQLVGVQDGEARESGCVWRNNHTAVCRAIVSLTDDTLDSAQILYIYHARIPKLVFPEFPDLNKLVIGESPDLKFVNISALTQLHEVDIVNNSKLESIIFGRITNFASLHKLVIRDNPDLKFLNVSALTHLQEIDIVNNSKLEFIVFGPTTRLTSLDLSFNKLSFIDEKIFGQETLRIVNLTGNSWPCKLLNYSWAVKLNEAGKLANPWNFNCTLYPEGEAWMAHTHRILHYFKANEDMNTECKNCAPNCTCEFYNLLAEETRINYTVRVNCSGQNLKKLPDKLPIGTLWLDASNNFISNLEQVRGYSGLLHLIMDNNNLTSAKGLLYNSYFISNFSLLSLRSNPIPPGEIPFTQFKADLSRRIILLENNSWSCTDVKDAKVDKWLWENRQLLYESSANQQQPLKIFCANKEGKPVDVFFLFPEVEERWDVLHAYYWVIGIEVALIFCVLAKVTFDAYDFITHGRLPWLAAKLF